MPCAARRVQKHLTHRVLIKAARNGHRQLEARLQFVAVDEFSAYEDFVVNSWARVEVSITGY